MNTSFKQDDRVELIEDYTTQLPKGTQGTVAGVVYNLGWDHEDLVKVKYDTAPYETNGTRVSRLKLVVPEYKEGDRVQVTIPAGDTESFGGAYFQTGTGTVDQVHSNGKRLLVSGEAVKEGSGPWWVGKKYVTPLVGELPFEVGARVRSKVGYLDAGSEGIVTRLEGDFGGDIEIAWDKGYAVAGHTLGARRSGLEVIASPVAERPKATPATETKPQIGDTIVAFWEAGGVETRKKGVIASFDYDGTAVTSEGEYITHDPDGGEAATDSVFIVERAPKPEPVKELPEQFLLDAPVGSRAVGQYDYEFIKTGLDEWKLILTYDLAAPRDSEELLLGYPNTVLFTP